MAKSILLDTRTSTFSEIIGNGKRFVVPPFQRDYSWTEENWEDLWNDLIPLRLEKGDRHYLGALVVEQSTEREYRIIDGQQRLATLSILALEVIRRLTDLAEEGIDSADNMERAVALRAHFIGEKDPASLVEYSKLTLNETDHGFYLDFLVALREHPNPRGLPRSNRLLWDCSRFFRARIRSQEEFASNGRALAEFLNETIAGQLLFILITVDNELNAYTVFETLNARGLELSATDLLKNYLFSCVKSKHDLSALQRRWKNLIARVRHEVFPEFLRYHYLCVEPRVRSNKLFKLVRSRVRSAREVLQLVEELEKRAEIFVALDDPEHEFWLDRPVCRRLIRERRVLGVSQMMPLLFAAWEGLAPQNFERVLKLTNVISFRFSTVSRLNTNELESTYHRAAKAVLDREAQDPRSVFNILGSIYVADDKFRSSFETLELDTNSRQGKRVARYVLLRLESDARKADVDFESDPSTIEHILPENPGVEWDDAFSEIERARATYRLGNLTLLSPGANRNIGNLGYANKRGAYEASSYRITAQIAELAPQEWSAALISERQKQLAARAVHIWRSDFE